MYRSVHLKTRQADHITVTEVEPGQRFAFHVVTPRHRTFDHTITLRPVEGGTALRHEVKARRLPPWKALAAWPPLPLAALAAAGALREFLKNLKADLEGRGVP